MEVPLFEGGRYEIGAALTRAPDYGIVEAAVNGEDLPNAFDGYVAGDVGKKVERVEHVFGTVDLDPGEHEIRFTAAGKHADSLGYMMGIDVISLRRGEGGR